MTRTSPTVRRRRLARELRRMRVEAGILPEDAAQEAGIAKSSLLRWEAAESSVQPAAAALLFRLYGASEEEISSLTQVAREARRRGWWVPWNAAMPPWLTTYVGLESETVEINEFQPVLVPGLLQIEGYAGAVMRAENPDETDEQIRKRVELRMQRQQRDDDYDLWAIIGEAALQIPVGGSEVMREQLLHVSEVAQQPRRNVQVLPASAGEHGSMGSGFITLRFDSPTDLPIAYLETRAGSLYVEEEDEVRQYTSLFQHLRATALSARESLRRIREIAKTI
ncbi:MAG: helix-turn-helix domain-containing protein [Micromonosporaceae bacterium]